MTVWKGMLSFPMNWKSSTFFGSCHQDFHSLVASLVIEMYPIGASNHT